MNTNLQAHPCFWLVQGRGADGFGDPPTSRNLIPCVTLAADVLRAERATDFPRVEWVTVWALVVCHCACVCVFLPSARWGVVGSWAKSWVKVPLVLGNRGEVRQGVVNMGEEWCLQDVWCNVWIRKVWHFLLDGRRGHCQSSVLCRRVREAPKPNYVQTDKFNHVHNSQKRKE